MVLSTFAISVFLMSVSFIGYAQCRNPPLTKFGKKVRKLIPDDNFDKIYSNNYKSMEELAKAREAGARNFYKVLGIPFQESYVKNIDDEDQRVGRITPELLFHANTYSISKAFRKLGILNDDNIDELAQDFADQINKYAPDVDKNDIFSVFQARTTAVANFEKAHGINTKEKVDLINKYYYDEYDMYQENSSPLGSFLGGLFEILKSLK